MLVRSWLRPLEVAIYPINGDGSDETAAYIVALSESQFEEIGTFIVEQATHHRLQPLPGFHIRLKHEIQALPPQPPQERSALAAIAWSLKMRYFAFHHTPFWENLGRIRFFVVFHQGEEGKPLQHSYGLHKGLVGAVHVFADKRQSRQNNVIIAHELFHALGATDKYDAAGRPIYPDGFPDPGEGERYPQHVAEIMAGRIAIRPDRAVIPLSLDDCAVGPKTAYEINW